MMADASPKVNFPIFRDSGSGSALQKAIPPTNDSAKSFNDEWYIRVKSEFRGVSLLQVKGEIVTEMGQRVAGLYEGLMSRLNGYDIHLLPQRLVDNSDVNTERTYICYWLIGLPDIPSTELGQSRKFLKEWQDEIARNETKGVTKTVKAKFIPRKTILEQDVREDIQDLHMTGTSTQLKPENRQTGETFKKKAGSNPAQVRKQFLQHAMGGDQASAYPQQSTGKLRPPKDVFNRLKYDAGYNLDEYVVGYIDRRAGILEKPVDKWEEYEEQELIAYFKHVPKDLIVWDRARKLDWICNPRPG